MTPPTTAPPRSSRPGPRRPAEPAQEDYPSAGDRAPFAVATAVALVAALALAVTWTASAAALDALAAVVEWVRSHNDAAARAAASVVLVATGALAFIVAWSRATAPDRPVRVPGGRGTIPVYELAAWLRDAIEARADVRGAAVHVQSHGKGVRVAVRIAVTADARLQDTTRGARAAIEQVLATNVGVPLAADPAIELRYEELRLHPRRAARHLDPRLEPLTHPDA